MYVCHSDPACAGEESFFRDASPVLKRRIGVNVRAAIYVKMLNGSALGIAAPKYSGLFYGSSNAE